jgi:hypothetical protein
VVGHLDPVAARAAVIAVGQIGLLLVVSATLTVWAVVVVPRLEPRLTGEDFLEICTAPAQSAAEAFQTRSGSSVRQLADRLRIETLLRVAEVIGDARMERLRH